MKVTLYGTFPVLFINFFTLSDLPGSFCLCNSSTFCRCNQVVCTAAWQTEGWVGEGSDNDKSKQTKGGSQEEIACLPEMCDSCCWKRGCKLENETIQEALWNRWIGTLASPSDFPVESLPLSPPDLSF